MCLTRCRETRTKLSEKKRAAIKTKVYWTDQTDHMIVYIYIYKYMTMVCSACVRTRPFLFFCLVPSWFHILIKYKMMRSVGTDNSVAAFIFHVYWLMTWARKQQKLDKYLFGGSWQAADINISIALLSY